MNDNLADAGERLADLLERENDALKQLDFAAAVALLPAKEAALIALTKHPRPATVSEPMVALGQRLVALAKENQTLLERAIAVQTRVVRIVARAYTAPPVVARYGNHGAPALSHRAAAIALFTRA